MCVKSKHLTSCTISLTCIFLTFKIKLLCLKTWKIEKLFKILLLKKSVLSSFQDTVIVLCESGVGYASHASNSAQSVIRLCPLP